MTEAAPRKRKIAVAALAVVGVGAVAAIGGVAYGRSMVRAKLEAVAQTAGLALEVGDIGLSPTGRVTVSDLHLRRADGTDVVAVQQVVAEISPAAAAAGSRRPERIAVSGLLVDIRVVDGRPQELFDLYRAVRSGRTRRAADGKPKVKRKGTALRVEGGEVRLSLRGKGAEMLPKGLSVRGLQVDFDPARNLGDFRATVDGSVASKLSAKLHPATDERPARVEATMSPELRVDLPPSNPLAKWVAAVVVRGFGYDAVTGPSINGVELLAAALPAKPEPAAKTKKKPKKKTRKKADKKSSGTGDNAPAAPVKLLVIDRVSTDDHGLLGIRADGIRFAAPPAITAALAAKLPLRDFVPAGSAEAAWLSTDSASASGTFQAALEGLRIPLPGEFGEVRLAAATMTVDNPGAGLKKSLRKVDLQDPVIDIVYRESTWKECALGIRLSGLITTARRGRVAKKLHDTDEGDDADTGRALPPEAKAAKPAKKGKRKRRRRSARKPFTLSLVKPLRALHAKLVGIPVRLDALIAAADAVPGLAVTMSGGAIGLRDPVAEKPFGGLRDLGMKLTSTLGDGTRGFELSARAFAAADDLGELRLDLTSATAGKLDRLKISASGGGLAKVAAAVGASASVQPDAHLGISATIKRQGKADLMVTGELASRHIGLDWWRLAPRPIDDFDIAAKVELVATAASPSIRLSTTELKSGEATASVLLEATDIGPGQATARLKFGLPRQDCGAIAAAIPASMMPTIGGIKAAGPLEMDFDLKIPLHKPYKGKLEATLADEECVVESFGEVDVGKLARPFTRPVNESGTILEDQEIGPKSEAWVDLVKLPAWVPYAMIATEDAAFYHHHGVRLGLLSRAIKMCLDHGRFVYGGSTITQQLVKNIYLTRDKNLARKFEELLIVWQMERNLLADRRKMAELELTDENRFVATKDRILELYINGIEFGPKLYGITRASREYFGKEPAELSPLEASFLAANKPCPKCGHKRFTTRKWTPWWQERMVSIMSKMRRDDIIDEDQFVAEAPYVPRFVGWPQTERKQPGSAIGGVPE